MSRHDAVNIPKTVLEYIDDLRDHRKIRRKYAFASRAEVVRRAIADFINRLENDIERPDIEELD